MLDLRDVVLMLAGAEAFHTLGHLWCAFALEFPLKIKVPRMTFTAGWNTFAIVVNGLVTAGLIWWAWRL